MDLEIFYRVFFLIYIYLGRNARIQDLSVKMFYKEETMFHFTQH